MEPHLRVAGPVSNLARTADMYCRGLGLRVLGSFENHDAFDGVMLAAGFGQVDSYNPYWETRGRTFEDPDGYRVVLQQAQWGNEEPAP